MSDVPLTVFELRNQNDVLNEALQRASANFAAAQATISHLQAQCEELRATVARPFEEWHEDFGNAVWWAWENGGWLGEPAYIGTPLDDGWPGYHTHWTPHPAPPIRSATKEA